MGFFSKSVRLQNLENRVETVIEIQLFFENRHKRVGGDRNPDLSFDAVEQGAEESFDSKMLLDPAEESAAADQRECYSAADGAMQGSGLFIFQLGTNLLEDGGQGGIVLHSLSEPAECPGDGNIV